MTLSFGKRFLNQLKLVVLLLASLTVLIVSACVSSQTPSATVLDPTPMITKTPVIVISPLDPPTRTPLTLAEPEPTPTPYLAEVELDSILKPQRLGIYYGWPSAVMSIDGDYASPYQLFSEFSVLVLGERLAEPSHSDHDNTVTLINALIARGVEVFGYVDMGISTRSQPSTREMLHAEIIAWRDAGVTGIFWDDVGYEFAKSLDYHDYRIRLLELVDLTRASGLRLFLNAWNPDDLFLPRTFAGENLPTVSLTDHDYVLAESWFHSDNVFVDPKTWFDKAEKLNTYREQMPFRLACVSTGDDLHSIEDTSPFQSSYWAAVLYNCNVFQFTNPHYSAGTSAEGNHIYVHALPDIAENDRFTTDISSMREESASEFLRLTQYGQIRVGSDGGEQGFGEYQLSGDLN